MDFDFCSSIRQVFADDYTNVVFIRYDSRLKGREPVYTYNTRDLDISKLLDDAYPAIIGKYLIINADDFGYSAERDAGIIDCFKKGAITNVSLMVNGVSAESGAKLGLEHNLPMGLHLNLSEGLPVGRGPYRTLVDVDGFFHGMMGTKEVIAKIDLQEVKAEIQCQIDKFSSLVGHLPDSVDGHQHFHIVPEIATAFASMLQQNDIQLTRLPIEPGVYTSDFPSPWGFTDTPEIRKKFMSITVDQAKEAKTVFAKHNVVAPTFTGLRTMGRDMTIDRLQTFIQEAFDQTPGDQPVCELMCHPGNRTGSNGGCGDGADDFSRSEDRVHEMKLVCSEQMKNFYRSQNIQLISFKDSLQYLTH